MSAHILTFHSRQADPSEQWMAFIETSKGRLGIYFSGPSEEVVKDKVRRFWRAQKIKNERGEK